VRGQSLLLMANFSDSYCCRGRHDGCRTAQKLAAFQQVEVESLHYNNDNGPPKVPVTANETAESQMSCSSHNRA